MSKLSNELRSVPAVNKQELLFYIASQFPSAFLKITTHSGSWHTGTLISVGTVRNADTVLVMQISDERVGLLNRFLHLEVSRIESIELINPDDVIDMLSLGKVIKSENYEPSGKLEVKKELQHFSESVFNATGVKVGVPQVALPEDGLKLNRILKLTQKIEQVIIDVLKAQDAVASWKGSYDKIVFVNSEAFEVKGENGTVEIRFPFENVNTPEISSQELTRLLLSIL